MKNPFANLFKKKKKDDANAPPVPQGGESKKKEGFFSKLLKNRLGKQSIKGEEILGVELTPSEIRLSQVSSNKANQWVLDKFYKRILTLYSTFTRIKTTDIQIGFFAKINW